MQIHICGTRGSIPTYGREFAEFGHDTSCYLIRDGKHALIMDCGSGLVHAAPLLSGCTRIDVMLSHVHYDHIIGLFDTKPFPESAEIHFYGEFAAWEQAARSSGPIPALYRISDLLCGAVHNIQPDTVYSLGDDFELRFARSNHPDCTCMIDIRQRGRRLCYTGDYEHYIGSRIADWARGCDLLLFDGSYDRESYPRFRGWGHSAWEDGCSIAAEAEAGLLAVTHHAPASTDAILELREQAARLYFPRTLFARQNGRIDL